MSISTSSRSRSSLNAEVKLDKEGTLSIKNALDLIPPFNGENSTKDWRQQLPQSTILKMELQQNLSSSLY